jgi:hypothetical protein
MITHLNYIEDKELRDYIYDELNKIRDIFNYIAVDEEIWGTNKSKIYAFKSLPDKNNLFWRSIYKYSQQLFYDSKYLTSSPSVYDVFNTTRDIFDIEKILENWKEDQRDNNDNSEDMLNKILNNFGLKINSVFQHRNNNKFFRINKHADIEEYINTGWRVTNLYEFIDIIDDMYDDDCPTFKFNVEKQFEEFKNKEKENQLSDETKEVIKSILNTNYSFIKIHPYDNRIVLHCPTDCCPLIINTNKETIKWFLNFIKNNTSGNKILYISRLKTFWKEYNHE